ncbi:hypothetical protein BLGI_3190 [Brevibacillus laterosporus GI-9]|nr:hypothetical protein BLGI_3190 [Brevibacillus laterosporus GI-9]
MVRFLSLVLIVVKRRKTLHRMRLQKAYMFVSMLAPENTGRLV